MKRPKTLNQRFVDTVTRPGRYGDGHGGYGLALVVKERGNGRVRKQWVQRIRIDGAPTNIGLGVYPFVGLAMARQRAYENRLAIEHGENPIQRGPKLPTFRAAADTVIGIHAESWKDSGKSAGQWRASLEAYAYPHIGDKPINTIETGDLLTVLLPIWNEKRETALRVRQRIGAICKWAVAKGYRETDPTGPALSAALPKIGNHRQHFQALPYPDVAAAIETVRQSGAHWATVACFEFLTLTATRSGEARLATWNEIDRDTWIIPGERMKAGREHRVPLSDRVQEILNDARERTGGDGLIFPSRTGRVMSDSSMSKLIRENGIGCVPHGMRSSFRQWTAEKTNAPREVCELALAHVNNDRVEAAYQRSDLYDLRARLMQSWADYLRGSSATIIDFPLTAEKF